MRISRRDHRMALELERRALELLGDRAPEWALEDAGEVGPNVQVVDDVADADDETGTDASGRTVPEAKRRAPEGPMETRWRVRLAARVEEELRREGVERAPAFAGAQEASNRARYGDPFDRVHAEARAAAQHYRRDRQDEIDSGRFVEDRALRVRAALIDLGTTESDAARAAGAAVAALPTDASLSALVVFALREVGRPGDISMMQSTLLASATPILFEGWREAPIRLVVDGKTVEVDPAANPQLAAALFTIAEFDTEDSEEPGDQNDHPAPPVES